MDVETMPYNGGEVWVVRAPHLVEKVFTDPRFSKDVQQAHNSFTDRVGLIEFARRAPHPSLITSDGDTHRELRRLHRHTFTRPRLTALREHITARAHELWSSLPTDTPVDLVPTFATHLPVTAITAALGLPGDLVDSLRSSVSTVFSGNPAAAAEIYTTVDTVVRDQPERLTTGMITDVLDQIGTPHAVLLATDLMIAGYESSASLVSAALRRALEHPGAETADLVEETLRHDPPFPLATWRFTTEDVTLGGVVVPAGSPVLLDVRTANQRTGSRLLTFGLGVHQCVGAQLGRLQAEVAVDTMRERSPHARVLDVGGWHDSVEIRKLESVVVMV